MPGLLTATELRQKRARLWEQQKAILEKAKTEAREALTPEETVEFDRIHADMESLAKQVDLIEKHEERASELSESRGTAAGRGDTRQAADAEVARAKRKDAYRAWLFGGMESLTPEQRQIMVQAQTALPPEARALGVASGSVGGFAVEPDFQKELEQAVKAYGGMREVARTISSATGASLPWPTVDDTGNVGAIIAENTAVTEQDVVFAQLSIDAYMYSSRLIRVPYQLLQDSAFDIEAFLRDALAERLFRITNSHFTNGTGTAQPYGAVTGSVVGKTGLAGQTTSVIYDDLVDLKHAVDPSHRRSARWMFADPTLRVIKKLKDSQNRPLWAPGITVREPDTIDGDPYTINQDVPVMAANARSILYGDFSKFIIRDVVGVTMVRLAERYADFLQVGFMAFSRHGSRLINAGSNPIKHYANSAT